MTRLVAAAVAAWLAGCGLAGAQSQIPLPPWEASWDASIFAGYTPPASLDRRAPELTQLQIGGSSMWGVQGSHLFSRHWGAEVLWTTGRTALEAGTADAGLFELYEMTVRHLTGDMFYQFGHDRRLRPFIFGGMGATFFSARDLAPETKVAFDFGGGVKYFVWKRVGIRAHIRLIPTLLDDQSSGDVCDAFGFCQNWLWQAEFAAGAVVRF